MFAFLYECSLNDCTDSYTMKKNPKSPLGLQSESSLLESTGELIGAFLKGERHPSHPISLRVSKKLGEHV